MAAFKKMRQSRWYQRFIKLQASPHAIAGGMALGVFIGMSPFFGLHIITAVGLAALFKWSKISALIGVQITNALTAPLIYPINYWIGSKLAGFSGEPAWPSEFSFTEFMQILRQSNQIILDLVVGGSVLGLPLALLGYVATLRLVHAYRRKHLPRASDERGRPDEGRTGGTGRRRIDTPSS